MMFHTSGLNTGSVRLETLIIGFCCACAGGEKIPAKANGENRGERGQAASRHFRHVQLPLVDFAGVVFVATIAAP